MKNSRERKVSVPPIEKTHAAFTLEELIAIIAVLTLTLMILLVLAASPPRRPRGGQRSRCISNLKQVGLAFRVWDGDNNNLYPMSYYTNSSGGLLYADATNAFRYLQAMSNELSNPQILICPDDNKHNAATNFGNDFNGNRISFFIGLQADETFPQAFLAGDTHLTNGLPAKNGILELTTNRLTGWTKKRHDGSGNIAMADGSVQQFSTSALQTAVQHTGFATNRLVIPR